MSAPFSSKCVAKECLSAWQVARFVTRASRTASRMHAEGRIRGSGGDDVPQFSLRCRLAAPERHIARRALGRPSDTWSKAHPGAPHREGQHEDRARTASRLSAIVFVRRRRRTAEAEPSILVALPVRTVISPRTKSRSLTLKDTVSSTSESSHEEVHSSRKQGFPVFFTRRPNASRETECCPPLPPPVNFHLCPINPAPP